MRSESNSYSQRWFQFFHAGIAENRTTQETDFVCACSPLADFPRVLDVCCGTGRHARALAVRDYSVTGIERDATAIAKARELAGGPNYIQADVRDHQFDAGAYDLAIVMSQSFGYFDDATNRDVLKRLAAGIRQGGRMVLDLWNPEFFATRQGERDLDLPDGIVRETKHVENGRLRVHLDYPDGGHDDFEWQLFTTTELTSLAESLELKLIISCTHFDVSVEPCSTKPRIQFVLERPRP